MSAETFILINRKTNEVSLRDMETNTQYGQTYHCDSINTAIDTAIKIMNKEVVEYGIFFKEDE